MSAGGLNQGPGSGEMAPEDAFVHRPVLLAEVVQGLQPRTGGVYVDGTVGAGGHAAALLEASAPEGRLWCCDRDPAAVAAATRSLEPFGDRVRILNMDYADLGGCLEQDSCDGMVLDLGVSSPQLDDANRGFSFRFDGDLDMRFDPRQGPTAADLVNQAEADELETWMKDMADERHARRIARAIAAQRCLSPIRTTTHLARLVQQVVPGRPGGIHPATRLFQALRIVVNDELNSLRRGLATAWQVLKPGARLAVITFHSGEDRIVKQFGQALARPYEITGEADIPEWRRPRAPQLAWVRRKPVEPSPAERAANPRARSAKLRLMEKLGTAGR